MTFGALKLPPIRHSVYIDSPIGRVYHTLTSAEGWDAWFTDGTSMDARPGGRIQLRWKEFGPDRISIEDGGEVLTVREPRTFEFTWRPGKTTTTVRFDLEPKGSGTIVRVSEHGHEINDEDLEALVTCASGWGEALTLLKFYLEHGLAYGRVPS